MYFEPMGLPCFNCILDPFSNYPSRTSISAEAFAVENETVTFFVSINAFKEFPQLKYIKVDVFH